MYAKMRLHIHPNVGNFGLKIIYFIYLYAKSKKYFLLNITQFLLTLCFKTLRIRYTFSSNHNLHKCSCGLCFMASDPLIDRFSKTLLIKGFEVQKQRPNELLWKFWFDEKGFFCQMIYHRTAIRLILSIYIFIFWKAISNNYFSGPQNYHNHLHRWIFNFIILSTAGHFDILHVQVLMVFLLK